MMGLHCAVLVAACRNRVWEQTRTRVSSANGASSLKSHKKSVYLHCSISAKLDICWSSKHHWLSMKAVKITLRLSISNGFSRRGAGGEKSLFNNENHMLNFSLTTDQRLGLEFHYWNLTLAKKEIINKKVKLRTEISHGERKAIHWSSVGITRTHQITCLPTEPTPQRHILV